MPDLLLEVRGAKRLPEPQLARAIRIDARVSQSRLAEELGVHWTTVARWERGERTPRGALRRAYTDLLLALAAEMTS